MRRKLLSAVPIVVFSIYVLSVFVEDLDAAKALSVNITVSDSPKLVALVDELSNPEDTNATITCSIGSGDTETLTYEWFKDDQRIIPVSGKIRIDTPAENYLSILRIYNLKPDDSALYSCVAKNRFGRDKIFTKLTVKVHLKWIEKPKDLKVSVGKIIHLPCRAEGSPAPRIEWRKIQSEDTTEEQILGSELRFNSIRQQDSGYYECRASNGAEADLTARVKIEVLGK